jgi:two-component system, sensor histidine kinase and response regulator
VQEQEKAGCRFREASRDHVTSDERRGRADDEVRELRRALEDAVEGIARLDRKGRYIAANTAYAAMLGCSPNDLIGLAWTETIHADHVDAMVADLARSLVAGKVEVETVGVRRDGASFDQSVVLVAVRDQRGEVTGHYCFGKDISRHKQAERDLRAAKRAAEAAMRARSDFVARMSHEIRTPMTGALGMIELALHTDLTAEQRDYLQTAQSSATSLVRLVDDILDFARIDAGHLRLDRSRFCLRSRVAAIMKTFAHRARSKDIDLQIDVSPEVPERLIGDPHRLGQILINLVSNAIKFTERGSIRLSVAVAGDVREQPVLRFEVVDTGGGIPRDEQALIFEDFHQGDDRVVSRHGGAGLGLAICRQLVQLMGGEIGVDSEPGCGSTFWFTSRLEVAAADVADVADAADVADVADAADAIDAPDATTLAPSPAPAGGRRILVAEDHPVNRRLATLVLERAGYQVVAVEDGLAAVEAAQRGDIDLVLMDMQMPVMDGPAAVRSIRQSERSGRRVPIIALTAQAGREERDGALAAGMDGHVAKPFRARALLLEIESVLARSAVPRPERDAATAAHHPARRAPAFDRARALRQIGGDEGLLDELIGVFMGDVDRRRDALRTAVAGDDGMLLARTTHALRGALLILAALPAAEIAREIEESIASGEPTEAAAMTLDFEIQLLVAELGRAAP